MDKRQEEGRKGLDKNQRLIGKCYYGGVIRALNCEEGRRKKDWPSLLLSLIVRPFSSSSLPSFSFPSPTLKSRNFSLHDKRGAQELKEG